MAKVATTPVHVEHHISLRIQLLESTASFIQKGMAWFARFCPVRRNRLCTFMLSARNESTHKPTDSNLAGLLLGRFVDKYEALGVDCMMHIYALLKSSTAAQIGQAICRAVSENGAHIVVITKSNKVSRTVCAVFLGAFALSALV